MKKAGNKATQSAAATVMTAPADSAGSSQQDLATQLRSDVIRCVLMPGQRLKFDELKNRYDVGIGSLREVLQQLSGEGLVISESNRGFCVAPVSVEDLDDLTRLRVELECKALTMSIEAGDDAWEAGVVAALHMLTKLKASAASLTDVSALWEERHRAFHEALIGACPSPWVMRFRKILFDQSQRYRSLSMIHSESPGRLDKHVELANLTLERDVAGATRALEAHILNTSQNVRKWLAEHQDQFADS